MKELSLMQKNLWEFMNYDRFFTSVSVPELNQLDSFSERFGFIGSCFSDHMSQRFQRHGLHAWTSPFGTTYNPVSIVNQLIGSIDLSFKFTSNEHNGMHFYWETSHALARLSKEQLLIETTNIRKSTFQELSQMSILFITLGTAWVYEHISSNTLVANCHKVPSAQFTKRLLTVAEITNAIQDLLNRLQPINPFLNLVLTVSPVRHLRDGLVENARSKARLIEACHQLKEANLGVQYFPAYELVIDELRDYRYYESDGMHPSALAIDHVWDKLAAALFHPDFRVLLNEVSSIKQMENHHFTAHSSPHSIQAHQELIAKRKHALSAHPIHW